MALENGYTFRSPAFPAPPQAIPNQTPSRAVSRESSRQDSPSPYLSSSPPILPPESDHHFHKQHGSQDVDKEEQISVLDPRRFTPNLHASLVSEILSLRREIESKESVVVDLEEDLHKTKAENGRLNETIRVHVKDTRAAKKHVQALESGTLSALGDLAKERDAAVEILTDTRKRLEASQNNVRLQEEEVKRCRALWDQDRQNWDNDRRNLERKVHIVEGRLKTMIAEVAAVQANGHYHAGTYHNNPIDDGSEVQEILRSRWSDTTSTRDTISTRTNSVKTRSRGMSSNTFDGSEVQSIEPLTSNRFSGFGGIKINGLSLAEELEFHEEDEDDLAENNVDSGLASPNALPEEALFEPRWSSESQSRDQKARKLLGLGNGSELPSQEESSQGGPMSILEQVLESSDEKEYRDSGTQFSPPPSPKAEAQQTEISAEKIIEQPEHAANQRRKRASIPVEQTLAAKLGARVNVPMVSAACQTVTEPASPILTPVIAIETSPPALTLEERLANMVSSSTQTDYEEVPTLPAAVTREKPPSMTVPIIAIHPPSSRPPSSRTSVVLPPRTKNVSCQASIELPKNTQSASVQTEIQTDERSVKLFPRLSASATSSKQTSGSQSDLEARPSQYTQEAPQRITRRNLQRPPPVEPPRARRRPASVRTKDSYPGNNDNGLLRRDQRGDLRRPVRSGSLFAGFDAPSDDNASADAEIDYSDDDFTTGEPVRKTLTKVQDSWKLIPQSANTLLGPLESRHETVQRVGRAHRTASPAAESSRTAKLAGKNKPTKKPAIPSIATKSDDIRRHALISSGTAAHAHRTGSPNASSATTQDVTAVAPPFPVPTRSSSRRIPTSASDGASSPTPYSTSFFTSHRKQEPVKPSGNNPLRKVQSATAVSRFNRKHGRQSPSRSPPPMSSSSVGLSSPQLPRMPRDDITSRYPNGHQQAGRRSNTVSSIFTASETPSEFPNQPTSVVDAIAQTMVGEWMWKYVRKRKSFGVTESPQVEFEAGRNNIDVGGSNGLRHKRWVWLAPYERAVLWSNKQPTSGPALMGKSGRKLVIQSVLDVKDDTPMPKNSGPQPAFGRSILVLTPQRALKFTATTQERHYIWLTALSFLGHSASGMDDIATARPLPQQEYPPAIPVGGGLRRTPIRDSIRVAKGRPRPTLNGRSYTSPFSHIRGQPIQEVVSPSLDIDEESDAAEPPHIPRTAGHSRKRSNTGPRPLLPNAFHSFPTQLAQTSTHSLRDTTAREPHPPYADTAQISAKGSINYRNADIHNLPPPVVRNNFFDAVGTIRMEAFVDSEEDRQNGYTQISLNKKERRSYRTRHGRKKDMSYWGVGVSAGSEMTHQGNEPRGRGDDPFKGF